MSEIEFWKSQLVRKASRAVVGGFRPSDDPLASWFGRVRVALPNEMWPTWDSRPMMALCQFNLTEMPFRPDNLADIAMITVFMNHDSLPIEDTPNGDQWLLRAYPSLDGLVPLEESEDRGTIKPFPMRWELIEEDYPNWDNVTTLGLKLPPDIDENYFDYFSTTVGTKVGGWASTIQSALYWAPYNQHDANPEYAFQIGTEPKANWGWGDSGYGYFGRGTGEHRDIWTMTWQCY